MHTATITSIQQASPSVKIFQLDYGQQPFHYLAGQWIDLYATINGKTEVGGYSMTSSPHQSGSHIELAVKSSTRHPVTRWLHESAQIGDTVQISDGQGVFVYQPEMSHRVVLVGAGVGVTPLISIFRYIAASVPQTDVTLVYSIPSADEYLFQADIETLSQQPNCHHLITLTQPDSNWQGRSGRIDAQLLREAGMSDDTLYYLCGPQGMVEDASAVLTSIGVPESRIIYEKWW
ncbi:ferredoxin--NADP reductase [Sulfuriferula thiophila]|uniref:ferredoxin--NADP reductase n=1 Tax=Sulfuriferula thiophila TaxID=1781211 RepID=UPI000F6068AC|nr:FAD-dependent oxidoreductase [Sulfuriferula thiophila]